MARLFSFNQALSRSGSLVTGPPFSVSAWVNITASMPTGGCVFAACAASQNDSYQINFNGLVPRLLTFTSGSGPIITGSAQPLNTWIHVVGVWSSTTSRSLYVNGVLIGTDATTAAPPSPLNNFIGAVAIGGSDFHSLFGLIAYLGVYNTGLIQSQVTSLFGEFDPSVAVPTGLISFPRLAAGLSPEPDTISTTAWTVTGSPALAMDPDAGTLVSPNLNDPRQAGLPEEGSNTYSYYLQPWKSYMDTWSGQKFVDGLGINFRPPSGAESGTAQVLAAAGFTHARMEFGWSGLQYANDTLIGSAQGQWTNNLNALKANGLRPLILLNNNLGGISPATSLTLTATASSAVNTNTITVASTTGIVLGKTGLSGQKPGYQTYPFITSISGLVCTLSAPLLVAVTSGNPIPCITLKYHPLCTGGTANSFSAETMNGWKTYVTTICTFVSGVLNNNNFDVEVINEDTSALDDNNFYNPANTSTGALTYTSTVYPTYTLNGNTPGDNRDVLVPITVDIVKTSFPGVRIINGMSNLRPQDNAFNTPPGVTAFSRHNYTNLNGVAAINGNYGVSNSSKPLFGGTAPPTNALYGYDGTPANSATAPAKPNPSTVTAGSFFIPTFTLSCPESVVGMGMKHEWMLTDLLPFPGLLTDGPGGTVYRGLHWRGGLNPITNQTVALWETETNTDRKVWVNGIMTPTNRDTDPTSINLWMYAGAKSLLRMFVFNIHKGMQTVCAFADRNVAEPYVLSIIPEAFYTALLASPGGALTQTIRDMAGSQIAAMTNMNALFQQYMDATAFSVNPLSVSSLSSYSNIVEFSGDGTAAHPDWRHVDGFGVFPFQVNKNTYLVGYYVVTKDVVHNWNVAGNTGALDIRNYTMPDEGYKISISGMGATTSVSSYDPMTGATLPVSILSQDSNSVQVTLLATDYPRFLVISTGASPTTAGYTDSPSLSSSGNWAMQAIAFKASGSVGSIQLQDSVFLTSGVVLDAAASDAHRGKGLLVPGSLLGLGATLNLKTPATLSPLTVAILTARDSHRASQGIQSGITLRSVSLDTHAGVVAISPGNRLTLTGAAARATAVPMSSGVGLSLNSVALLIESEAIVSGNTLLSLVMQDTHRAVAPVHPGSILSALGRDMHQGVLSAIPGALISVVARDTHSSGESALPSSLLTLRSRDTHRSISSDSLGSVLTGLIQYRHQGSAPVTLGALMSLTSQDAHQASYATVQGSVLGLFPAFTAGGITTLPGMASLSQQANLLPVSQARHNGIPSFVPGSFLFPIPLMIKSGVSNAVIEGVVLALQSIDMHQAAYSVSTGALLSLVTQDAHQALENSIASVAVSLVSRVSHGALEQVLAGSLLSLVSRATHLGRSSVSSGNILNLVSSVTHRAVTSTSLGATVTAIDAQFVMPSLFVQSGSTIQPITAAAASCICDIEPGVFAEIIPGAISNTSTGIERSFEWDLSAQVTFVGVINEPSPQTYTRIPKRTPRRY